MSMADRDGFIWYDGKLAPWRDAVTYVLTHSLPYHSVGISKGTHVPGRCRQHDAPRIPPIRKVDSRKMDTMRLGPIVHKLQTTCFCPAKERSATFAYWIPPV